MAFQYIGYKSMRKWLIVFLSLIGIILLITAYLKIKSDMVVGGKVFSIREKILNRSSNQTYFGYRLGTAKIHADSLYDEFGLVVHLITIETPDGDIESDILFEFKDDSLFSLRIEPRCTDNPYVSTEIELSLSDLYTRKYGKPDVKEGLSYIWYRGNVVIVFNKASNCPQIEYFLWDKFLRIRERQKMEREEGYNHLLEKI